MLIAQTTEFQIFESLFNTEWILHCSRWQNSEKAMATHSSTLAWKIPWMEEPGSLQSMGSLRIGHDWATSLSLLTFMHWRRKWQPLQCSCLENPRNGGAGGLPSMGSLRDRHDWSDLAAAAANDRTRMNVITQRLIVYNTWIILALLKNKMEIWRKREKERVWENFWRDYSWKLP